MIFSIGTIATVGSKVLPYLKKPSIIIIGILLLALGWQTWTKHLVKLDLAEEEKKVLKWESDFNTLNSAYEACKQANADYETELTRKDAAIKGLKDKEALVAQDCEEQVKFWKSRYEAAMAKVPTVPVDEMAREEGVVDRETSDDYIRALNNRLGM